MHRWRPAQKRVMLAAMLVPWVLVLIAGAALGVVFEDGDAAPSAVDVTIVCFFAGFAVALVTALTCVADALLDRRVEGRGRAGWTAALLLAPAVAGAAYWWLHVRPAEGEPHGLDALRPARRWPVRAKVLTGAGALFSMVFFLAFWAAADGSPFGADAVPLFALFGVWTVVTGAVVAALFLDALREGGDHASRWATLLVLVFPFAAPLYWLLYVRPTGPRDGGP